MHSPLWNAQKSADIFHLDVWGRGYLTINEEGDVVVDSRPEADDGFKVTLMEAYKELKSQGGSLPALIRFPEILDHRLNYIESAFGQAIDAHQYRGSQKTCYPIKTNHRRRVVERLCENGVGIEVGSKAELTVGLGEILKNKDLPLLCNGYKDADYLDLATRLHMSGIDITVTLENTAEVLAMVDCAKRLGDCPKIGLRLRLNTTGSTPWAHSSGENGMFGLLGTQLLYSINIVSEAGHREKITMLHYHLGSQISNLNSVSNAAFEASKIYCELVKDGLKLKILDVGGGIAVDYGKQESPPDEDFDSFTYKDYSVNEYANEVVRAIKEQTDYFGVAPPTIYCESGRALVAHHSVFLFEVFEAPEILTQPLVREEEIPAELKLLMLACRRAPPNFGEINKLHQTILSKYRADRLPLKVKAEADRISRLAIYQGLDSPHRWYFGNLSIFQSLPDMWGVKQVFPVMPIHRLNEQPDIEARISDITCDSDGKFSRFQNNGSETLHLHRIRKGEPYILGVFNVGAYQETIGDIHNLLARTSTMSVNFNEDGTPLYHLDFAGDSIADVLVPVGYVPGDILDNAIHHFNHASMMGKIDGQVAEESIQKLDEIMGGTTYLNLHDDSQRPEDGQTSST